jgi:hypothetical protein
MALGSTSAQLAWAIKQNYTPKVRRAATVRKTPLLSKLDTRTLQGEPMKVPMIGSAGAGVGSTYAAAAEAARGMVGAQFLVYPADFVGVVPISFRSDLISSGDKGGFFDLKKKEAELAFGRLGQDIAIQLGGNGGGALAKSASAAGNVLTLTDPGTAANFVEGMILQSSVNDGSQVGHVLKTGQMLVTAVDVDGNTVTVDNTAGITGFAQTDFLFRKSIFAGNTTNPVFKGLGALFPLAAPSDTLHGLVRTGNPRYAGFRLPSATGNPLERLKALSTHGFTVYGSQAPLAAVHTKQWEQISKLLTNQGYREIVVGEHTASIGYSKLLINGAGGEVEIMGDPFLPTTQAWLLDTETTFIGHYGKGLTNIQGQDSSDGDMALSMYFPSYQELGSEIRMYSFCNLASEAPWLSGTVALPALPAGV